MADRCPSLGTEMNESNRVWPCRKCSQPILPPRFLCDTCKQPRKSWHRKGYSYVGSAKTLDDRIERQERINQHAKKQKRMVRAANAVYRELQGKPEKPSRPTLPPPTCVICGIVLTGFRKRILCGSKSCEAARIEERWRCQYYGKPLSATPRMVAAVDQYPILTRTKKGSTLGRFRNPKPRKSRRLPASYTRARDANKQSVYHAMREMNLLPEENES